MVIIGGEHTADTRRIKRRQATLIIMHVGMLIIRTTVGRDAESCLHRTSSDDMISHINRSAIHRALFTRRVEEVDQLPRTRGYTAEVTDISGQANGRLLDRVFGEDELAVMVVEQQ